MQVHFPPGGGLARTIHEYGCITGNSELCRTSLLVSELATTRPETLSVLESRVLPVGNLKRDPSS
jgi:hypothetical protein